MLWYRMINNVRNKFRNFFEFLMSQIYFLKALLIFQISNKPPMITEVIPTIPPTWFVHSAVGVDWHMLNVIHWPTVNHKTIIKTILIKIENATSLFLDKLFISQLY